MAEQHVVVRSSDVSPGRSAVTPTPSRIRLSCQSPALYRIGCWIAWLISHLSFERVLCLTLGDASLLEVDSADYPWTQIHYQVECLSGFNGIKQRNLPCPVVLQTWFTYKVIALIILYFNLKIYNVKLSKLILKNISVNVYLGTSVRIH